MSETTNGRIKVSPGLLVQIAIWLVSVLLAYGALSERIAVLESYRITDSQRMERVEAKLDTLLQRVQ